MIIATTGRLILRDLRPADADNILLLNSDPEVLKHVHDVPFADEDAARQWINDIPGQLPFGFGRWAIERRQGVWIGRCSLRRDAEGETQMGYRLLRAHWGQGFATEVVSALRDLAFEEFGVPYIVVNVARENAASARVVEKCGGHLWKEGPAVNFADALVYRIDRP